MKIYTLYAESHMPISIEEAWQFFSLPTNLAKITPPEVKFETLTNLGDNRIYNGQRIKYRLRPLLNIPMGWETEIREVDAPNKFMDKQMKGPYALWEHTHTFIKTEKGVKMTDVVKYALPMGILGQMMHSLIVRKKLEEIFRFRESTLVGLFGEYKE